MPSEVMSSDSTRRRILLAAGPIFARKGFGQTTVREICEAAEANLASINYYFGDKEKLYAETILLAQELQIKQNPQPVFQPGTAPNVKLRLMIETLLKRMMAMQTGPWQVRLIMREVLQPTAASQGLIETYFRPYFEALLEVIDELHGSDLSAATRRKIGISIIGQCLIYRTSGEMMSKMFRPEEQFDVSIESLTDHISEFSLSAIAGMRERSVDCVPQPTSSFDA
jgi:TetR/AcrR family transcriptional regulator, regulator of cefoperazone and chloramphenicol sensitivity